MVYPKTIAKLPPFEQWVSNVIKNAMLVGENVNEDAVSISMLPVSHTDATMCGSLNF